MGIQIREAKSKADLQAFVQLPFNIYKNNAYWVPGLKSDELKSLLPEHNPSFEFCEVKWWLAEKNGKVVGRIGGIINRLWNEKVNEKTARFSRLEFFEDPDVCRALLQTAEAWAKEKGMNKVEGPLGFSNLDTQGMLVEGFDHLPSVASVYHLPYYGGMVEACGYQKLVDWLEFRLTIGEQAVQKANRGAQLIQKRYGIEVLHFTKTSEMLPYSKAIFGILNDAFSELPFVSPLTDKLMEYYQEKYIKFLNPEFVKMVRINDELIGFIIGMPSLSEAMRKANGSLWPFGFWHILQARKGVDVLDQMLTGVKKDYISTGAGVILMAELQNAMLKKGMRYIETTGIFETNSNAISNWKNYEHIQHKRKRCFVKEL